MEKERKKKRERERKKTVKESKKGKGWGAREDKYTHNNVLFFVSECSLCMAIIMS